ncbi:uncharacterized protein [Triticum aestivum]|uniref:uncharacterized protein n=1 Tax=Triticum aestivum TaxID=4565 RepID=UPI001D034F13|nr:uncharacterized protein LOC123063181 [Triticum aestivum]
MGREFVRRMASMRRATRYAPSSLPAAPLLVAGWFDLSEAVVPLQATNVLGGEYFPWNQIDETGNETFLVLDAGRVFRGTHSNVTSHLQLTRVLFDHCPSMNFTLCPANDFGYWWQILSLGWHLGLVPSVYVYCADSLIFTGAGINDQLFSPFPTFLNNAHLCAALLRLALG